MANPFGDCDDEEYEKYEKSRSNTLGESNNPFGDDEETNNLSNLNNSYQSLTVGSSSRQISYSGQSLDSNQNSDSMSINSNNYVGSYTLGEGSVEKEGLFCPMCFEEFRQITDMIEHAEKFHSQNSGTTKPNQIKGFFNKIKSKAQIVKPNFDINESIDEKNIDPTFNPTEDWKQSMRPGKFSPFS